MKLQVCGRGGGDRDGALLLLRGVGAEPSQRRRAAVAVGRAAVLCLQRLRVRNRFVARAFATRTSSMYSQVAIGRGDWDNGVHDEQCHVFFFSGPVMFVAERYSGGTVPRLEYNPYSWTKVSAKYLYISTDIEAN